MSRHFSRSAGCSLVTLLNELVLVQRAVRAVITIDAPAGADQIHGLAPSAGLAANYAMQLFERVDLTEARDRVSGLSIGPRPIPGSANGPDR